MHFSCSGGSLKASAAAYTSHCSLVPEVNEKATRVTRTRRPAFQAIERLIATGRAEPAKRDLLAPARKTAGRTKTSLSEALREIRDDRL